MDKQKISVEFLTWGEKDDIQKLKIFIVNKT